MDPIVIFFIFLFLVLMGGIIAVGIMTERKRKASYAAFAAGRGFEYLPEATSGPVMKVLESELAAGGRHHSLKNVILGHYSDIYLALFDLSFITGSGKNSQRHVHTVLMMPTAGAVPDFRLKPEGLFERIGDRFNPQDIDFVNYPEFSRMFVLKGDNEEQVRAFFNDARIRFLESWPGISIEAMSNNLLYYHYGKTLRAGEILPWVDECIRFHRLLESKARS